MTPNTVAWYSVYMLRLNAFQLKIIAVVLMIGDHIGIYTAPVMPDWFTLSLRYPGRLVLPIFIFLLIEAFFKTSNRARLIARMWAWAMGMFVLSFLLVKVLALRIPLGSFYVAQTNIDLFFLGVGHNIFFTFALMLTLLWCVHGFIHASLASRVVRILALLAVSLFLYAAEAGYIVGPLGLVFYAFYTQPRKQWIGFVGVSAILCVYALTQPGFWLYGYQWLMVAALPLLMFYNGERGPRTFWSKYAFYIIYPTHLWILYTLAQLFSWRYI